MVLYLVAWLIVVGLIRLKVYPKIQYPDEKSHISGHGDFLCLNSLTVKITRFWTSVYKIRRTFLGDRVGFG